MGDVLLVEAWRCDVCRNVIVVPYDDAQRTETGVVCSECCRRLVERSRRAKEVECRSNG